MNKLTSLLIGFSFCNKLIVSILLLSGFLTLPYFFAATPLAHAHVHWTYTSHDWGLTDWTAWTASLDQLTKWPPSKKGLLTSFYNPEKLKGYINYNFNKYLYSFIISSVGIRKVNYTASIIGSQFEMYDNVCIAIKVL